MKKTVSLILIFVLILPILTGCDSIIDLLKGKKEVEITNIKKAMDVLPSEQAKMYIFEKLNGYWSFEDNFVGFIIKEGSIMLEYGILQSSYGISGEVIDVIKTGENAITVSIHVLAAEANELDDGHDERDEEIYVDLSTFEFDDTISAKVENLKDGEWHTYAYCGMSLENIDYGYSDMKEIIAALPGENAKNSFFGWLTGYCIESGCFVGFSTEGEEYFLNMVFVIMVFPFEEKLRI